MSHTPLPTSFPTRRQALAAERATIRREHDTRPIVLRTPPSTTSSHGSTRAGRTALTPRVGHHRVRLTVFGTVAAALLFTTNATPALAADLAGNGTPSTTSVPRASQTYTVTGSTQLAATRDGYSVASPASVIAHTVLPLTTTAGSSAAGAGSVRWPFPTAVRLSSTFGYRSAPCASCSSHHEGIDMLGGAGNPIGAIAAGTVRISTVDPNYGQYVVIDHVIGGQHVSSLYAHMIYGSSPLRVGDTVAAGSFVGRVGSTGDSTGAHLHLSILLNGATFIDPLAFLRSNAGPLQ